MLQDCVKPSDVGEDESNDGGDHDDRDDGHNGGKVKVDDDDSGYDDNKL